MKNNNLVGICFAFIFLFYNCAKKENKIYRSNPFFAQILKANKYIYSESKTEIPQFVVDSLSIIRKGVFKIADNSELALVDTVYSDVTGRNATYDQLFRFIVKSDSACLFLFSAVDYGLGGTRDIIVYCIYGKRVWISKKYLSLDIKDTSHLEQFLKSPECPPFLKSINKNGLINK